MSIESVFSVRKRRARGSLRVLEEPPYTYIFVAMEPSGNWLKTEAEGRRFSEGHSSFPTTPNDSVLVFDIQRFLLRECEGFRIPTGLLDSLVSSS